MKTDPILKGPKFYTKDGTRYRLTVNGGVHYIRGNSQPRFTLTATQDRKERGRWADDCCGCCHDLILKHWPELSDLAAMHLSDLDGAPMYAEANGWYSFAASLGGAGERYHAGNSEQNMPCVAPKDKPWQTTEYRYPTADECLQIFADHARVSYARADELRQNIKAAIIRYSIADGYSREQAESGEYGLRACKEGRSIFAQWIEAQRPRWKKEAADCIARHGLVIYGDAWEAA